ncbi:LacI family DNA-binding transcriptional regulator [Pengzhenrongella frigida]|uniref:LacI family DNA-binding transcriptional regulator n=1 Tax=Pengzhenrongella frigida TaxID=1259133 RepID=UPI001F5D352C|nr:LacI family DNA-binding transcriptional regulator [Cellulomonas sp. HLT2-17]
MTAKDVAREAGVSQATVSYVINNTAHQKISDETRERVLAAVAALRYTPSAAARALRRGSSDLVLLVLPDVPLGPNIAHFMESITDELEPHGLTAITRRTRDSTPVSGLWRELRPVAVIGLSSFGEQDELEMREAGIHVVSALLSPVSGRSMLSVPQTLVGRMQVEHLAATGHRRIGYAAPDDARVSEYFHLRLYGVRTACLDLGLDEPYVLPVSLDVPAGEAAVRAWRAGENPVTGVCAYNDETAFAILSGMYSLGLAAPRDLAVIGVDNIPLAQLATPPLTTIDQNLEAVAAFMARTIVAAIAGRRPPRSRAADVVTLVVRESA